VCKSHNPHFVATLTGFHRYRFAPVSPPRHNVHGFALATVGQVVRELDAEIIGPFARHLIDCIHAEKGDAA
jgi:hypothetical protein